MLNYRIWIPPHLLALRVLATRYDCSRISVYGLPPLCKTVLSKVAIATASVYSASL
jgi:hypothetical protein